MEQVDCALEKLIVSVLALDELPMAVGGTTLALRAMQ